MPSPIDVFNFPCQRQNGVGGHKKPQNATFGQETSMKHYSDEQGFYSSNVKQSDLSSE